MKLSFKEIELQVLFNIIINNDEYGSIKQDEGFVVVRDLLYDQNGRWIIGFCRYLENCIMI